MVSFQFVATCFNGFSSYVSGVSGMAIYQTGTTVRLYAANGHQGGLLARDPLRNLAVTESRAFDPLRAGERAGTTELEVIRLGGKDVLISYGHGFGADAVLLSNTAALATRLDVSAFSTATLLAVKSMALADGRDLIFTSSLQSTGITSWWRDAVGNITRAQQLIPDGAIAGYDVMDMELMQRGRTAFLVSLSAQDHSLALWRIGGGGAALLVDRLGGLDNLAVTAPHLLETVQLAGRNFVLLGAAGSSSITVLELLATDRLQMRDQVMDDLNTRFQGVSVLETLSVDGRVFVVAGGSDDGLSLLTLLPNGRLLHLATIADSLNTTLDNVSALTLRANGTGLDIFVTGWSETGLTQFTVDLGALAPALIGTSAGGAVAGDARADLIIGGTGRDRLFGADGDDILVDSPDADQFYGGGGADVFVFVPDGARDEVRDFTLGLDRLDLSALGRIYSREALTFSPLPGGIILWAAGEKIALYSANGQDILPEQLTDAMLFGATHANPGLATGTARLLTGSELGDMLLGKAGNDTLIGLGGGDFLQGGDGTDMIRGDAGCDRLWGGGGNDTLQGGAHRDWLWGQDGDDVLQGGAGNDTLSGGRGNDWLESGTGNDLLTGGPGADSFVFERSWGGSHRITDFTSLDLVDLNGFGYLRFSQVQAHLTQQGADVVFADQGVRISFANHTLAQLGAGDFLL